MENLNGKIVTAIRENIPRNQKTVGYIADLLSVSRESAYRRIRGEKEFTLEETHKISCDLNISIDEMFGSIGNECVYYNLQANTLFDPENSFLEMLRKNNELVKQLIRSPKTEVIAALNRLSFITHMPYKNLFKFLYYRYLYQIHDVPLNFYYSTIVIPEEIEQLRQEYTYYSPSINNITYIMDNNIFPKVIKEILYYYKRNLITRDELIVMQEDLYYLVDVIERMVKYGLNDGGSKRAVYISTFDLDSNFRYIEYDDTVISEFWVYPVNPLTIKDTNVCALQKKWLGGMKKYSTLISESSELQQSEYLNTQRNYIKNMLEGNS